MSVVDFVARLGSDARLLRQFERDPHATARSAGLSIDQISKAMPAKAWAAGTISVVTANAVR